MKTMKNVKLSLCAAVGLLLLTMLQSCVVAVPAGGYRTGYYRPYPRYRAYPPPPPVAYRRHYGPRYSPGYGPRRW